MEITGGMQFRFSLILRPSLINKKLALRGRGEFIFESKC